METVKGAEAGRDEVEDAIFDTAIHIRDEKRRRMFLERSFSGDPEGLARMEELLELAGESAAFFIETRKHRALLAEEVLVDFAGGGKEWRREPATLDEEPGAMIGRYRLIRRIGAGGCGVVYEAEQEEPVRRKVALKLIRLGMDTEMVISRFEIERQAQALMDHPNIARVLDAGAAGGRPYFVMELVKGERITSYCDAEKLGIPSRLSLFIQVCNAIQHAHQKGIIHRDIKPSNILVATHDGAAMPKVIDFGIAKAAERRRRGRMSTEMDQMVGTPAYMSPEQVDMGGVDIDTRGDVYSLGALLYELLSGRPPFDGDELMKCGMSEMRRILMEQDPPFPSSHLAEPGAEADEIAARRCCDKAWLVAQLKGDLDWIVMKAMDKDRNRRYQTVSGLAADVRRFLSNEPVIARRPARLYFLGKFIRRNRAACASGVAVALSLCGGMGTATVLYLRERAALEEQARLSDEAEAARAEEARLRSQAQARGNISRVAVLLSEGKVEEADSLLQKNPLDFIDPSREAADVFRSLGNWYAIYGRWEQAVQCFVLLNQANRLDQRESILEGSDLLYTAPAFLELGDVKGYETFRRKTQDLYLPAKNALEGERLLKVCLLLPADKQTLNRLASTAEVCKAGVRPQSKRGMFPEWNAFSLALYHYRLGEWQEVLAWARKSSEYPDRAGSRLLSLRCLTAMTRKHLGDTGEALADLKAAKAMMPAPPRLDEEHRTPLPGTWFSWSVARILLREAEALVLGGENSAYPAGSSMLKQ